MFGFSRRKVEEPATVETGETEEQGDGVNRDNDEVGSFEAFGLTDGAGGEFEVEEIEDEDPTELGVGGDVQ